MSLIKDLPKNEYVYIFTLEKIELIIPTAFCTRYKTCFFGNLLFGLNDAENIRYLVNQDETVEKLIYVAAKTIL